MRPITVIQCAICGAYRLVHPPLSFCMAKSRYKPRLCLKHLQEKKEKSSREYHVANRLRNNRLTKEWYQRTVRARNERTKYLESLTPEALLELMGYKIRSKRRKNK